MQNISSVSIDSNGNAAIGGLDIFNTPYAALVDASGHVTNISGNAPYPIGDGVINSVSKNANLAIIGGTDLNRKRPYAGIVHSNGEVGAIFNEGPDKFSNGQIISISMNSSGSSIIGGVEKDNQLYAALVLSTGYAVKLGIPPSVGAILSVDINDADIPQFIIGGYTDTATYAGISDSQGHIHNIMGVPTDSIIKSVAINNSGNGIIGGLMNAKTDIYAAIVSPAGVATTISPLPGQGQINSVDINDSGIGILGGVASDSAYIALVSPTGIASDISPSLTGSSSINSVAIEHLDNIALFSPCTKNFKSTVHALNNQVTSHTLTPTKVYNTLADEEATEEISLVADLSDRLRFLPECAEKSSVFLWLSPLFSYVERDTEKGNPGFDNYTGAGTLGLEYRGMKDMVLGSALSYAYSYMSFKEDAGCADANQGFLSLYYMLTKKHFYIDTAIWAGYYDICNTRRTFHIIEAHSDFDGWILAPHLEMSVPFAVNNSTWLMLDPFGIVDWINNWQGSIHETGASGLNLNIDSHYTSLLQSELGLRIFQMVKMGWGEIVMYEKGSWVYNVPFCTDDASAFFTGSTTLFGVALFEDDPVSLGAVQFNALFIPCAKKYPYGVINYEGQFGSGVQFHLASLEIGYRF